jgi:hypothetical protein
VHNFKFVSAENIQATFLTACDDETVLKLVTKFRREYESTFLVELGREGAKKHRNTLLSLPADEECFHFTPFFSTFCRYLRKYSSGVSN